MEKFVDDGMLLQMKITLIICQNENFYYKNKWWLHSNKEGSHIIPLRNRSADFQQALSTLERKKLENLLTLTSTNSGSSHRVHLPDGGIGKIPGGLLTIWKVKEEASQLLNER